MGWIASRFRRRSSPVVVEHAAAEEREPELVQTPEPPPEPQRDPDPEPPPVAEPRPVVPREWNLWELERIARERSADDAGRNEERGYLLMYLREFASADGMLPADFDDLVRESFGDALDPAHV